MAGAWRAATRLLAALPMAGLTAWGAPETTEPSLPPSLAGVDLTLLLPEWNRFYELSAGAGPT
ncbi:MAG TPA: hypothetical protein PKW90_28050, partial [Myxococcota bacterium]|nr:hypothetical protein [Myxococcota bacterium]